MSENVCEHLRYCFRCGAKSDLIPTYRDLEHLVVNGYVCKGCIDHNIEWHRKQRAKMTGGDST